MNLTSSSFVRLLGALEDLAAQTEAQLASEDFDAMRSTQERATPLVNELAKLGSSAVTPGIRPRLQALLERRERSQEHLAKQVAHVKDALLRTQSQQRRIAQVAPAYRRPIAKGALRQLSAQG
ncbi:MAG: hypothetical protein JWM32_1529 [Verrucomicrobia bacterium]|nr:hypothetical protein [Verrucomicrobiota bacterium]